MINMKIDIYKTSSFNKNDYSEIIEKYQLEENNTEGFVAEVQALLFFDKQFKLTNLLSEQDMIKNNYPKTPDWIFTIDKQKVIVEVYNQQINKNNFDQIKELKSKGYTTLFFNKKRLNSKTFKDKLTKYKDLVIENNALYFIFIKVDYLGDDDIISLKQFLYAKEYHDITNKSFESSYSNFSGLFYTSDSSKNISGIILLKDDEISYFHNYQSALNMDSKIKDILMKYKFRDD